MIERFIKKKYFVIALLVLIVGTAYVVLQVYIANDSSKEPGTQKNKIGTSSDQRLQFLHDKVSLLELDEETVAEYENDSGCNTKNYGFGQGNITKCYYRVVKEYEDTDKKLYFQLSDLANGLEMERPNADYRYGPLKFRKKFDDKYLYICIDRYEQQDFITVNTTITFTEGEDTSCTDYGYN